jgi:hypothetical protein
MKRLFFTALCLSSTVLADTHYVDINNVSPSSPYTNWATAASSIEDAVSASSDGDLILVESGTYHPQAQDGIAVDKAVIIQSQNGPAATVIDGQNFCRGFKVDHEEVVISGFTITRGYGTYYDIYEHMWKPASGGGVECPPHLSDSVVVSNCVIRECNAAGGGGMFGGMAINSHFIGNISTYDGGGMMMGTAKNCLFRYNHADYDGGGVTDGFVFNCTIVENSCGGSGGGIKYNEIYNSIIYHNLELGGNTPDNTSGGSYHYSCAPDLTHGTDGNITNAPLFINQASGNFHLFTNSPCADAGLSAYAVSLPADLDGNTRIVNARVDMGAYEIQPPWSGTYMPIKATLEKSLDLQSWTNSGQEVEWLVPIDFSNQFYRARLEI